jgi:hypothetical protein
MLGQPVRPSVPFFWSQHHDVTLGYVGHAEKFDEPTIKGSLEARDAHVIYREGGVIRAVVTIGQRAEIAVRGEATCSVGRYRCPRSVATFARVDLVHIPDNGRPISVEIGLARLAVGDVDDYG